MTRHDEASEALYEVRDHVAIVTLNRPAALNAVNARLSAEVGAALERADHDESVRAIVITGSGRAFCAGADLRELAAGRDIYDRDHPEWGFAGVVRHWISKPLIAAVNGFALGGGTEIVLASDLAVIDETASLGLPEVRRGLLAAAGGVIRLQRQIPFKVAAEIALTGEAISAERALELGLVNGVAPSATTLEVALQLATTIAANAPLAVRETKHVMHASATAGSDWDNGPWAVNNAAMKAVFASEDAREGARAFTEKRSPVWKGK